MVVEKGKKKKLYGVISLCAAIVAAIAVVAACVCGSFVPSKRSFTEVTPVSGETETGASAIVALAQGYEGEEYFIVGKATLEKRCAKDDALLEKIDYRREIRELAAENDLTLRNGSLEDFYCKYVTVDETERYLLAVDAVGNIFKYVDSENGLVLSDDYFVTDKNYSYKESVNDGGVLYTLCSDEKSVNVLRKWDVRALGGGATAARYIWNVEKVNDDGSYVLTTSAPNIKTWVVTVDEDYIYLALSNGIYKIAKNFSDYGSDLLFFEEAESLYEERYLRLLCVKATELELEFAENATYSDLEQLLKANDTTVSELSKMKREARTLVSADSAWCEEYTGTTVTVAKEYCEFKNYSQSKYGSNAPFGVAYDENSEIFYIAGDYALYALRKEVLGTIDFADDSLERYTTTMDLDIDGRSFNSVTPIVYNACSDCLYLAYENVDLISIVSVENEPKILYTFHADYSIQKQIGDANNETYRYLALSAATNELYVRSIQPSKTLSGSTFKTLRTISWIVAVVGLIVACIAFYGYKSDRGAEKLRIIRKDFVKNKWVYLALTPFIVLICLFCYYEAIGSISFSFYEYTQAKPTRNWNNFNNYRVITSDPAFWRTVKNMLFFLVMDIILAIAPPVLFAFMLSIMQGKKYSKWTRTLLFIPGILPGVATMLIWRIGIFGDTGVLNMLAKLFGAKQPIQFLYNSDISTWSLLLMGFPFVGSYLIFYGGMMNIPSSYYEAAELEGISVTRRLFQIDIPLIAAQLKYVFITTFISSVQNYSRTYMLGSDAKTPVHNLYERMTAGNYGEASAYAVLIFLFLLVAMVVNFRDQKKELEGTL